MPDLDHVKHAMTKLPVEQTILNRWSPRAFAEKPVSDTDLTTVFTAGTWAASSQNEQPWRFLVGRKGDSTYEAARPGRCLPEHRAGGDRAWPAHPRDGRVRCCHTVRVLRCAFGFRTGCMLGAGVSGRPRQPAGEVSTDGAGSSRAPSPCRRGL